ncbi:MAG TPA: class I SAM-dependent methyltransferase [Acidimicrobiia bacterium]|nr:class I SAM-dependent methyltransferase [Acidimicrobiia bacterium]
MTRRDDPRRHWDERHAGESVGEPSQFLVSLADELPRRGRAIDLAGGRGRHALWLADHGLEVTLADVSLVALETAQAEAAERGIELTLLEVDLEREAMPAGPWDVIVCFHYLHRPLFPPMIEALRAGGVLAVEIATVHNLQRHDRPPRAFLLQEGELTSLTRGLQPITYTEGWTESGRHNARYAGRKPGPDERR